MVKIRKEAFLKSVYGKVIAAFLIGVLAIGGAGLISKGGFSEMLQTVESLSEANPKLHIINNLFYRVTQLEQLQHAHAIENPTDSQNVFTPEVKSVLASIDSLKKLCENNPGQMARVDSMGFLLIQREKLAQNYFNLRADLEKNRDLNKKVITLSKQMATLEPQAENPKWREKNRVVTTTKKTSTTSIIPPKTRRELRKAAAMKKKPEGSFFQRLFASKSNPAKIKKGSQQVKEDIQVRTDTFSVGREYRDYIKADQELRVVERELRVVERNYFQQSAALLARELALVKASHKLNRELLDLLKTFEAEELGKVKGDYFTATTVVNSSLKWMNAIMVVFFLGAALFAYLILLDISRGKKLQQALQHAKEEAEHLSQVKQRFLANMSHELRTPLQSILGFSEQVRHEEKPDPEAVDAIYHSAEHLLQIVNEVLDYSRIISGKFSFEAQAFDLQQITKEVVTTLSPQANKKGLDLNFDFVCDNARYVSGDPFRLKQVLFNIVGNAIKFTDKGSVSLTVKCSQVGDRALFSFKVKDTGIGIPEKDINRIFNQFEQSSGNDVQKHGGTGLGLSIAKSLIESQGGMLTVTSKNGQGSIFEIQIPYQLQEKPVVAVETLASAPAMNFEGEVLLVDDDAIILKLCSAILKKNNIKHTCLNSSVKAAETAWPETLKFVFTDIQMPGMSGFELNKTLRKKLSPDAKIYAFTARALPEEHAEILAAGFDGILMKPFREKELLQVINSGTATKVANQQERLIDDVTEDFGAIGYICADDPELFQSTLTLFVSETRADLDMLSIYIAQDSAELAVEIVHKLAGCVGQLGALKLSDRLKEHEQQLKAGKKLAAINADLKLAVSEVEKLMAMASRKTGACRRFSISFCFN